MQGVKLRFVRQDKMLEIDIPVHEVIGQWITVGDSILNNLFCGFISARENVQVSLWRDFLMVKRFGRIYFGFRAIHIFQSQSDCIQVSIEGSTGSSLEIDLCKFFVFYSRCFSDTNYERIKREFSQRNDKRKFDFASSRELIYAIVNFINSEMNLLEFQHGTEVTSAGLWLMALLSDLKGYGPLTGLFSLGDVTEISLIHPDQCWIESAGCWKRVSFPFASWSLLEQWLLRQSGKVGAELFSQRGFSDFSLDCGSRVHVAFAPVTRVAGSVTIRCHRALRLTLNQLEDLGMFTGLQYDAMLGAIRDKKNILVVGPTSSGKTTLLSALVEGCGPNERILVLEDVAELQLKNSHVVYLQTRGSHQADGVQIALEDLVREALRMRPDRIVVGECRGKEAFALLQALHTGHRGSLCTIHGNSVVDALDRFQTLVLQAQPSLSSELVKRMIYSSIDVVIFVSRDSFGVRRMQELKFLDRGYYAAV